MRRVFSLLILAVPGFIGTLVTPDGKASAESISCGVTEVTFTTGGTNSLEPSLNADGSRVAFRFDRNLIGGNADGNFEIFLHDATASSFTQVTDTVGGDNRAPSISGDGSRIAFLSDHDLTGGNADGNIEIFYYDANTGSLAQVSDTPAGIGNNQPPSLSGDGMHIAFASQGDLAGGNADGNYEIFLYDTSTNSLTQVTDTVGGGNLAPSISGDGSRIAFLSDRDLTGGNADGSLEIFLAYTATNGFTQATDTTGGDIDRPSLSADGTRIAFDSNSPQLAGGNLDGNREIFLYDAATGGIAQVTFTTGGIQAAGSISGDGTRIAFTSDRDLTGGNADGSWEIFLYETTTGSFTQVSDNPGGISFDASISSDGTRIAFESLEFPDLGNADGNYEIFLASCLTPQPPPPPSSADVLISQSADQASVRQGDTLTYTVTVRNFGPDGAADVVVNDALSSGAAFVSAQANKGTFTTPPVNQTGTVTWNLGSMASGDQEAAQIRVTVIIRGRDTITNTATVSSSTADPNPANNSSSLATTVQPGTGKKK